MSALAGYQPESSRVRSVHEAVPTLISPMGTVHRVGGPTGNRNGVQAARRSRVCLQATQEVADGKISSRSTGMGAVQPSQKP